MKIVGRRRIPQTPQERHAASWILEREVRMLNPWPRPRGFVFKARTREAYEEWRRKQTNPWLW